MQNVFYLFNLDYGERTDYLPFLKDIYKNYDRKSLVGTTFFVNNNPYNLQLKLLIVLNKNVYDFGEWLKEKYPNFYYYTLFNTSINKVFTKYFNKREFVSYSFSNVDDINALLSKRKNNLFLFPDKETVNKDNIEKPDRFHVFLSHASIDKNLIDVIYEDLNCANVDIWYDKFEIDYGDSISEKINTGLSKSDLGLVCISKSFLQSSWAKSELNYFIQRRMTSRKNDFIILNLDCKHLELPPLVQDIKYLSLKNEHWKFELCRIINLKALKKISVTDWKYY